MSVENSVILDASAEHIREGRLDAAEEILRAYLDVAPRSLGAAKQLTAIAIQRGDIERAKAMVTDVINANDRDAEAYALLCTVYLSSAQPEEALTAAQRAVALDGESVRHAMNLALAEQSAGLIEQGLARLVALAAEHDRSAEIAYNLGTSYLHCARPDLAREELLRATRLNPKGVDGWANLASVEHALGHDQAAFEAIERALLGDPLNPLLLVSKAGMLSDVGRQDESLALAQRAITLKPGTPQPLIVKAVALARKGDWVAAAGSFAQVCKLDPDNIEAALGLAVVMRHQGKPRESLLAYERVERLMGQVASPEFRRDRVELLLQLGRFEDGFALWFELRGDGTKPARTRSLEGVERILLVADPDPSVTILLLRYIPLLVERGIEVRVAAPDYCAELIGRLAGVSAVLRVRDEVPDDHVIMPMRELPWRLAAGVTGAAVAPYVPAPATGYLTEPADMASTGPIAAAGGSPSIGIAIHSYAENWAPAGWGEPALADVIEALGVSEQAIVQLRPQPTLDALLRTMSGLDVVISVDNEVAHLAAALGKPTIVLLTSRGGWAWPETAAASPWYPATQLLRQQVPGDFSEPLSQLSEMVHALTTQPQRS